MKIGASTACFYPLETEKAVHELTALNFKTIEIFFNSFSELEPQFIDTVNNELNKNSCTVASVHPFTSAFESFMFFSRYTRRFEDSVLYYDMFFRAAQQLGAKKLVLHGGRLEDAYKLSDEEYCRRFALISQQAKKFGIRLLHENVRGHRACSPEFITKMKRLIPQYAAFVLDIKQAIRSGCKPIELVKAMGGSLEHIHINDNTPDSDCLLPGFGYFDFLEFFKAVKDTGYDGEAIIEVYRANFENENDIKNSLEYLCSILQKVV